MSARDTYGKEINLIVLGSFTDKLVVSKGVPHCTDEDDVWNGYFIPKVTNVFGNVWAIHMDPNTYPDPTTFNPDRFLGKHAEGADSNDRDQLSMTKIVVR